MNMKLVLLAALIMAISSAARALEVRDGDNNPIPGLSPHYTVEAPSLGAFAKQHPSARRADPRAAARSGTENPNVVMWRGRAIGEDPDPSVRSQILRNATGG